MASPPAGLFKRSRNSAATGSSLSRRISARISAPVSHGALVSRVTLSKAHAAVGAARQAAPTAASIRRASGAERSAALRRRVQYYQQPA